MSAARQPFNMQAVAALRALIRCGLFSAVFLLSSCVLAPVAEIAELADDEGNVELILEPVDVWDNGDAGDAETFTVNEQQLSFRVRSAELLDQAWVRLGLFWHSRQDNIQMPLVIVGGPPVTIRRVQIQAGRSRETLQPAKNFNFTAGKRPLDDVLHSGAFSITPEMLSAIAEADDVYVTILTSRGVLRVNLAVVTGSSDNQLASSAKYQFADFSRRQQAIAANAQ